MEPRGAAYDPGDPLSYERASTVSKGIHTICPQQWGLNLPFAGPRLGPGTRQPGLHLLIWPATEAQNALKVTVSINTQDQKGKSHQREPAGDEVAALLFSSCE